MSGGSGGGSSGGDSAGGLQPYVRPLLAAVLSAVSCLLLVTAGCLCYRRHPGQFRARCGSGSSDGGGQRPVYDFIYKANPTSSGTLQASDALRWLTGLPSSVVLSCTPTLCTLSLTPPRVVPLITNRHTQYSPLSLGLSSIKPCYDMI